MVYKNNDFKITIINMIYELKEDTNKYENEDHENKQMNKTMKIIQDIKMYFNKENL